MREKLWKTKGQEPQIETLIFSFKMVFILLNMLPLFGNVPPLCDQGMHQTKDNFLRIHFENICIDVGIRVFSHEWIYGKSI